MVPAREVFRNFPAPLIVAFYLLSALAILVFFLVFTYEGTVLALRTKDNSPILDIPKVFWYVIMPVSGMAFIGYTVRDLVLLFRRRPLS